MSKEEDYRNLAGNITAFTDNTCYYEDWLVIQQYVDDWLDEIDRLNNIIDIILDFPFFKEECPLSFGFVEKELETKAQDVFYEDEWCEKNCDGNYKKCWLKYFDKLKELKGEKNEKD